MKKFILIPTPKTDEFQLSSNVEIVGQQLIIQYELSGPVEILEIRKERTNKRRWDLWEESCFEFFLKDKERPYYLEFNFSTSGDWNAFYCANYRVNEGEYNKIKSVDISVKYSKSKIELTATLSLEEMTFYKASDFFSGKLQAGITSITMKPNHTKTYWALTNFKNDKADFHLWESFKDL